MGWFKMSILVFFKMIVTEEEDIKSCELYCESSYWLIGHSQAAERKLFLIKAAVNGTENKKKVIQNQCRTKQCNIMNYVCLGLFYFCGRQLEKLETWPNLNAINLQSCFSLRFQLLVRVILIIMVQCYRMRITPGPPVTPTPVTHKLPWTEASSGVQQIKSRGTNGEESNVNPGSYL